MSMIRLIKMTHLSNDVTSFFLEPFVELIEEWICGPNGATWGRSRFDANRIDLPPETISTESSMEYSDILPNRYAN